MLNTPFLWSQLCGFIPDETMVSGGVFSKNGGRYYHLTMIFHYFEPLSSPLSNPLFTITSDQQGIINDKSHGY